MTRSLLRRDFILAGAASAIAGCLPAPLSAGPPITAQEFLALSKKLTGVEDLAPAIAGVILGGFLAIGQGPILAQLASGGAGDPRAKAVADAVVAAWYSGIYSTGRGKAVATFVRARVWDALSYTKPFGICGGETGYWANAPLR